MIAILVCSRPHVILPCKRLASLDSKSMAAGERGVEAHVHLLCPLSGGKTCGIGSWNAERCIGPTLADCVVLQGMESSELIEKSTSL
jgi:hypothetical protein